MEGKTGARRYWWVEDLVDSEAKAMGVYLTLFGLLIGRKMRFLTFETKPSASSIMDDEDVRRLYYLYLAGRGDEARLAFEAGRMFVERLFEHEDALSYDRRRQILCEIEREFYDDFLKAFKRYLKLDQIPEELKRKVQEVLRAVRSGLLGGEAITPAGTFAISDDVFYSNLKDYYGFGPNEARTLIDKCFDSRLIITEYYGGGGPTYDIFPAPCLSDEIIELVTKPLEVASIIPPPPRPERFEVKPSREVLEGIVASVLEDLGFKAFTNARKEPRRGSPIEVDVWAQRIVANTRFSVYVSCRNWDKAIDRSVVDEETGRVLNLRELPQLKVIIAKELTSPAREAAEADGFLVIELGRKAEADTAREIYELVYKTLSELFFSIAPPRLREIASRIADVRERLREIEGELTSLLTR
jgi:hypothetical protein